MAPKRQTRRRLAYGIFFQLTAIIVWMLCPGDIQPLEQALAMVMVPSLIGGLIAFISGETYSDHSARKHGDQ